MYLENGIADISNPSRNVCLMRQRNGEISTPFTLVHTKRKKGKEGTSKTMSLC